VKTQRYRENAGEDGARDWKDAPTSQGMSRIAHCHKNLREKYGTGIPSEPSKELTLFIP